MVDNKENTEDKIIDAAIVIFVDKGYDGSRMQEIADKAGINKALLHYYFRSKDKLFSRVFAHVFAEIIEALAVILDNSQTMEQLITDFVNVYIDFLKKKPYVPIFVLHEMHRNPEMIVNLVKSKGVNKNALIKLLIKEGERDDIRNFNPIHIFINLMSMSIFPFVGAPLIKGFLFDGNDYLYDNFIDERKEHIVDFVKAAILKSN